jgi:hypothetical protein
MSIAVRCLALRRCGAAGISACGITGGGPQFDLRGIERMPFESKRRFPMRYFALALSAVITLASIPAIAAVTSNPSQRTILAYDSCPVYEGYPDCHPGGASAQSAYSGRAYRARA